MKHAIVPTLFILLLLLNATSFAVEPASMQGMVSSHNEVRTKYEQQPLTWSDSLADYAQEWVDHLADTQNCQMTHRPDHTDKTNKNFQQVHGENLYWSSALVYESGKIEEEVFTAKGIVDTWASEEDFYDYETNTCLIDADCGHYTQIVWHETKEVGCAVAVCSDKSQIWACNYSPRGNYRGEWPF